MVYEYKTGGALVNVSKNLGAPMVKSKDFTMVLTNLCRGHVLLEPIPLDYVTV